MRRPLQLFLIVAASLGVATAPAAAQSWGHNSGQGHDRGASNRAPSAFDWRSQLDRPGDYRCDAFWDASRTDCHARWRDQRRRVSPRARRDYHALAGYGRNQGYHGHARSYGDRYGYGRSFRRRGYGDAYGHGYGYGAPAATAYHGAYGRPDLVYGGGGRGYAGRDPGRVRWCASRYRSYDPHSGYYRAYSGRLVFCG